MRLSIVRSIYLKELRETLRDRRTIGFMLVLPLVLYPMMIIGMTRFQESIEEEIRMRTARLALWGEAPPGLLDELRARKFEVLPGKALTDDLRSRLAKAEFPPFERIPEADSPKTQKRADEMREAASDHPLVVTARPAILDRSIDLVLVVYPQKARDGVIHTAILYDTVRQDSRRARGRLDTALEGFSRKLLAMRETERGLTEGFTTGIETRARDVAPKARRSGFGLGTALPFILLAISASAGFYRAVDTTAGEKERNTMQTLLCAPVRPIEIVAGKFAAISTITLIAAGANIVSLGLTFGNVSRQIGGMSLSPSQYALVFAVLVPVTLLTSALFLAVGVFAKDFRDGQNLLTPVMLVTMMPAAITMIPGVESNLYIMMAPCVNVAMLIKALLVGEAKPDQIFITLVSSAAYAVLALTFAARVFERESLLTGGKDTFRGLFGFGEKRREVTPSLAFACFCAVLVLIFYGSVLPRMDLRFFLLFVEYGLILLPTVAIVLALRLPPAETLSLRWPGWRPMFAGLFIGASGWAVAHALLRLLPPPESLARALQKVMLLDRIDIPFAYVLFLGAISPGLCEELFFRGLIQSGFRKLPMWTAILASGLLFGVAHGSIYRMLPVTLLGMLFAYLAWRSRSVFPGMLAHAVNNGVGISIVAFAPLRDYVVSQKMQFIPLSWSAAGAVVLVIGLMLARGRRRDQNTSFNPN
ncbi:MAG: CPBP family intramembrane metalloprotease [Acidobacteria bacterium]|nr:CPBP family intramembrane metalloprotease [Acidobacteriota bacterium]